jgi:predicted NBD/HSP70 family sugar kinase
MPAEDLERSPQARLRRQHERAIFRAINAHGTISRTQLASYIGLSGQSIGRVVRDLLESGLVEETSIERPEGPGAPPVGLRVRPEGAFAFGFGLERDCLTGVVLDLGGRVRWQVSRNLAQGELASTTLRRIEEDVQSLLKAPEWANVRTSLCGLGMATPGPIDLTTGTIVGAPNFPSWEHVNVAEEIRRTLDIPVVMDNAATASAIGVEWRMPRSHGPFLYCYWGVGIGGGLVLDDEVYRGATGNAIEIGHVVVEPDGHPCECGGVGCLEAEASASALLRDAAEIGRFGSVAEVIEAALTDPAVAALVQRAAERMALAILSVLNIVDVGDVVIGGEHFHDVEKVFLPVIRERIEQRAFRRRVALTRVTVSGLGEVATAIGAAALVFHSLLPGGMPRQLVQERPAKLSLVRGDRSRMDRAVGS